ncbi:hypothetical protein [Streptomyces flavalbus]|uniref:Uncharacterized protein n=1 Tax=Streptomyces flavalbus TaxID=2665155 RepID=A0ABW2W9X3_9ACTN
MSGSGGGATSGRGRPTSRSALVADLGAAGAGWCTVCFAVPGAVADGGGQRVRVGWRAGSGPAVVRTDVPLPLPLPLPLPSPGDPCAHPPGWLPCDAHLWADADARGTPEGAFPVASLREQADVLVSRAPLPLPAACRRVRDLLDGHPGCLVAVVPGAATGCVVGVRNAVLGVRWAWVEKAEPVPPRVVASVAHAWAAAGGAPGALWGVTEALPA